MAFFELLHKDKNSNARAGILKTAHGVVQTPSFVVVGTNAEVRCLRPSDIPFTKTQMIIANTYHLWRELGESLENFKGLHEHTGWGVPIMTDSGGFQVFSLGFGREHKIGKVAVSNKDSEYSISSIWEKVKHENNDENLVRITDNGAYFMESSEEIFLDAETSIKIQEKLGADIILAFDECTSPLHDYEYTRRAMERTHKWAKRCLQAKTRDDQQLFGIVQGGIFEDLRRASAEFIGRLPFDGFAIGGSFGADSESGGINFQEIKWSVPYLPEEKPRHLLGIGKINDLFAAVELGIDSFDCVVPTREARHGAIWTRNGRFAIGRGLYKNDDTKIDNDCNCPVCGEWNIRRKDLHALFKVKDANAARLATIHNVYFFNDLMEKIRRAILEDKFQEFRQEFFSRQRK